jgi:nucleoside 2-deoxyribosyltransferase
MLRFKTAKKESLICYLAGPMEGTSAENAIEWRDRITPKLNEYFGNKLEVIDPCKTESAKLGDLIEPGTDLKDTKKIMKGWKESGKWDKFDKAIYSIIVEDLWAVQKSDFLIVYLDFDIQMGGTISELTYALLHRTPVYAIIKDPVSKINSWVLGMVRHTGKYYPNFTQLIDDVFEDYREFKNAGTQDSNSKS